LYHGNIVYKITARTVEEASAIAEDLLRKSNPEATNQVDKFDVTPSN